MDPVTAAGIGLSAASLALQVFAGCIKGYEMFIEVSDMPREYEYLRTRLRIEQSRCLIWREKAGISEDLLAEPSQLLALNGNLVIEILGQIQACFRSCMSMAYRYDNVAAPDELHGSDELQASAGRRSTFHRKTLATWQKSGRLTARLEWAMIKKRDFEKLITRLVQYNDHIEGLLDRYSIDEVRSLQAQANLTLLQMSTELGQVRILVEALRLQPGQPGVTSDDGFPSPAGLGAAALSESRHRNNKCIASLAAFKAQQLRLHVSPAPATALSIRPQDVVLERPPTYVGRQVANFGKHLVWLEWRESIDEALSEPQYRSNVEERVQQLALILSAADKPAEFRSPRCHGYLRCEKNGEPRFAFVYSWPSEAENDAGQLISLREVLESQGDTPELAARISVARMVASSLLYLHAVDWIHKDTRSSNVLFLHKAGKGTDVSNPIISGFDFARPALPEAATVSHQFTVEHDLYRHPDLLQADPGRSKKSHDIYSLGLMLAEIALWRPIEQITQLEVRRSKLRKVKPTMLGKKPDVLADIAQRAGQVFAKVVEDCLVGGAALDLTPDADEEDPKVAAALSNGMYRSVVQKLEGIHV